MRPLLIFGLRGTLVERIHVRRMPTGMPQPDLTVGLSKVWLRPHMLATLRELQRHCDLALWSSTTQRNTSPLVDAVFNTARFFEATPTSAAAAAAGPGDAAMSAATSSRVGAADAADGADGGRFRRRRDAEAVDAAAPSSRATPSGSAAPFQSPIVFKFVWSREHTSTDDFRRRNVSSEDDAHATVKDLSLVFQRFPTLARPENTVLIDDTPSKGKHHAENFLWLDSCEGLGVQDERAMVELRRFVTEELCKAKDVRELLPARIRRGG